MAIIVLPKLNENHTAAGWFFLCGYFEALFSQEWALTTSTVYEVIAECEYYIQYYIYEKNSWRSVST